MINTQKYLFFY